MRSGTSPAHCGCRVKGAAVFCHLSKFSKFVMEVITDFMTRGQKAREAVSETENFCTVGERKTDCDYRYKLAHC